MSDSASTEPPAWVRQQDLVAALEGILGDRAEVVSPANLTDRNGIEREADVAIHFSEGRRSFTAVVEVRKRKS